MTARRLDWKIYQTNLTSKPFVKPILRVLKQSNPQEHFWGHWFTYSTLLKSFDYLNAIEGFFFIKNWISIQVNDYEIVVKFFHISHNLTWYSAIVHKFIIIYPVCSKDDLTKKFMYSKRITCMTLEIVWSHYDPSRI